MTKQLRDIAQIFAKVAQEENEQLSKLCNEGIFFMPELAFAYACGKAVMEEKAEIFGEIKVNWIREENIGADGPSDLIFVLPDGVKIVVEFKMRSTLDSYLADIRKLNKLDASTHVRIFCALVDAFKEKKSDDRIDNLGPSASLETIPLQPLFTPFLKFSTIQHWYKGNISCVVGVWLVGESPSIFS